MSYSFVPAAVNYSKCLGLGAYVKYTKSSSDKIIIKHIDTNYIWLVCPDRELVLVKDAHNIESFHPAGENFDEYVDLCMSNDNVTKELNCDVWMPNYFAHAGENAKSPNLRRAGINPNGMGEERPRILADSGGFQLFVGVVEYLDPAEVVKWYNNNVDWGMVLDIPPMVKDEEILYYSAQIQKANTDIMMKNKKPHVELLNVVHGFSIEQRHKFHEIVFDKRIDRMAMAGYNGTTLSATGELLSMMYNTKHGINHYQHYHMLGIYYLQHMAILIKMGNLKDVKLITSDSSTHIQSARHKTYHHQATIVTPERRLVIGDKSSIPESMKFFPCSCPVCSTLKYMDILSVLDSSLSVSLLALHNLHEITRYASMMDSICRDVSPKEYRGILKAQFGSNGATEALRGLDLVESVETHGYAYGANKYSSYFRGDQGLRFKSTPTTLFSTDRMTEEELEMVELSEVSALDKEQAKKASLAVLDRYGKREGISIKHGKKVKNKERDETQKGAAPRFASKVQSAGIKKKNKKSKKPETKSEGGAKIISIDRDIEPEVKVKRVKK